MDANGPIRKRIVISLDSPPGSASPGGSLRRERQVYHAPRKARRWPKVVAIFLVLLFMFTLALALGGFFWWRHYQSTPAYSIALIIDAAQRNDMNAFQERIDDDAIARNLVAEVRQKAASRYGIALSEALQKQIDTLVPSLLPHLKERIHDEVAKEIKDFASKSEPKPFVVVALALPRFVTITLDGEQAKVTMPMANRTIELGLHRDGELWKVTDFKDDVLLQQVVDSVMKDLPAIGGVKPDTSLLDLLRKPSKRR